MDIVLSWSGEHSKSIAFSLYEWLPKVIPGVVPWMSSEDISKRKRWFDQLLTQLNSCRACVICLTPQNVQSLWIFFEAGAIASKKDDAHLFTYLVGNKGPELKNTPLEHYQWTNPDKEDTWKLIRDLNKALEKTHDERLLRPNFDAHWDALKTKLDEVQRELNELQKESSRTPKQQKTESFSPTPQEIELILKLSDSHEGVVHKIKSDLGTHYMVDGYTFNMNCKPREHAAWTSAFDRLLKTDVIENREGNTGRYHLTEKGFQAAEAILAKQHPSLSPEALRMLFEASKDQHGVILKSSTLQGTTFTTNRVEFGELGNARSEAKWKAAAQELASQGFVDSSTPGHSMTYKVNAVGYAASEKITPESIQDVDISK